MPPPSSPPNTLEASVASLAVELRSFVKDSEDHRGRIERDQNAIWTAIKDQGKQLTDAVEKLSARGSITWPAVLMTIGTMLGLIGAASTIGHAYVENRIRQLEIIDKQAERENDITLRRIEKIEDARIRDLEDRAKQ